MSNYAASIAFGTPIRHLYLCDSYQDNYVLDLTEQYKGVAKIIERPKQPKPWSGPEDGLPPVGSEVELGRDCILSRIDDFKLFEKGTRVLVGGHANFGGVDVAVIHREHDSQGYTATLCQYLEPVRTPQQIAAEKRETAIRELMDIAQVDCRVTAARLVDAGFKLPSKSGEDREQGISDLRDHIAHANFRRSPNSGDEELAKQLYGAGFRRERTPDNPFR